MMRPFHISAFVLAFALSQYTHAEVICKDGLSTSKINADELPAFVSKFKNYTGLLESNPIFADWSTASKVPLEVRKQQVEIDSRDWTSPLKLVASGDEDSYSRRVDGALVVSLPRNELAPRLRYLVEHSYSEPILVNDNLLYMGLILPHSISSILGHTGQRVPMQEISGLQRRQSFAIAHPDGRIEYRARGGAGKEILARALSRGHGKLIFYRAETSFSAARVQLIKELAETGDIKKTRGTLLRAMKDWLEKDLRGLNSDLNVSPSTIQQWKEDHKKLQANFDRLKAEKVPREFARIALEELSQVPVLFMTPTKKHARFFYKGEGSQITQYEIDVAALVSSTEDALVGRDLMAVEFGLSFYNLVSAMKSVGSIKGATPLPQEEVDALGIYVPPLDVPLPGPQN